MYRNSHKQRVDFVSQARLLMENGHEYAEYMDSLRFKRKKIETTLFSRDFDRLSLPSIAWYKPTLTSTGTSEGNHTMSPEEEKLMFLRFNYAKLKLGRLKKALAGKKIFHRDAKEFILWHRRMVFLREYIVRSNLALVLAMGRRLRLHSLSFDEIVSEGNEALRKAMNKFDVDRNFKFATYACRAIIQNIARLHKKERLRNKRHLQCEEIREPTSAYRDARRAEQEAFYEEMLREALDTNAAKLSLVEITILTRYFNLDRVCDSGLILEEIGEIVGVTKERVRQIKSRALEKIRKVIKLAEAA